jgi:hypothetical protein
MVYDVEPVADCVATHSHRPDLFPTSRRRPPVRRGMGPKGRIFHATSSQRPPIRDAVGGLRRRADAARDGVSADVTPRRGGVVACESQ